MPDLPGLLEAGFGGPPESSFGTDDGSGHRLWVATDATWQEKVTQAFAGLPLLIADGHHRYETALTYAAYTIDPATCAAFNSHRLWLTVPFTVFGIVRFLSLVSGKAGRGLRSESPTQEMLSDVPFMLNLVATDTVCLRLLPCPEGLQASVHAGPSGLQHVRR